MKSVFTSIKYYKKKKDRITRPTVRFDFVDIQLS